MELACADTPHTEAKHSNVLSKYLKFNNGKDCLNILLVFGIMKKYTIDKIYSNNKSQEQVNKIESLKLLSGR